MAILCWDDAVPRHQHGLARASPRKQFLDPSDGLTLPDWSYCGTHPWMDLLSIKMPPMTINVLT
jgi:hypothetical protein